MSKQSLLVEDVDFNEVDNEVIIEKAEHPGAAGKKNYYIKGPYVQAEVKNGNGRVYPRAVLENQVAQYGTRIQANRAMGELGHPSTTEINLDRVSHVVKELKMEKNDGMGKSLVMSTPMGRIAQALIDEGVKLGVSSRGVGTLKENIVQNDFRLIAIDIVADPSAPDAFVDGIFESKKEWILENGILVEKDLEQIKNDLDVYAAEDIRTASAKAFSDALIAIRKNL